ncbi:DTW domain-containing protein [Sulfurimonas aquatica]|uniref:tRNA-uridine aminocarboxypropyltransferase n=1 Tax=Sulfurimonas aquatica TaxID=2672570 RepID=A0A975GCD4_9BACT|nr:tRNA-uridine aminocarboxypropyltransferase [Sulfurimonas aquatica]QSZ41601.1 DTW domain-containing protein [Sulfurimonas aquatica]
MSQTFYGDREKCYKCYRPKSSCMCKHFENIKTQTKFVVLMHPKEFKKVKNNTGHFTHQTLENSELFIGIDFSDNARINEIIKSHDSYILFPSDNALNLSETNPKKSDKELAIFIIDSTWACTTKMFTLSKNLQALKHMSFTTSKSSQYKIKVQPEDYCLSTIESTLVVLEELNRWSVESVKESQIDGFLKPFEEMIAYQQKLIENPLSNAVRFKRGR